MRVNVETRALSGAKRLSIRININHYEALGRLVALWAASQDEEVAVAHEVDIEAWFFPDKKYDGSERPGLLESLAETGFIKLLSNGGWEIKGNREHIKKLKKLRVNAKKGGLAKARANGKPKAIANALATSSAQYNAIQCNTIQCKPKTNTVARSAIEQVYARYPIKTGKKEGIDLLVSQIKTEDQLKDLNLAMDRFIEHHRTKGTEMQMIVRFPRWARAGRWRDWLDPETGSGRDFAKDKPRDLSYLDGL